MANRCVKDMAYELQPMDEWNSKRTQNTSTVSFNYNNPKESTVKLPTYPSRGNGSLSLRISINGGGTRKENGIYEWIKLDNSVISAPPTAIVVTSRCTNLFGHLDTLLITYLQTYKLE